MPNATITKDARQRVDRMGFRVDQPTKQLVERAAQLERRKLTDYCLSALTEAAERTIARHETLVLTEEERLAFFDVLVSPPQVDDRLRRAFKAERRRVAA